MNADDIKKAQALSEGLAAINKSKKVEKKLIKPLPKVSSELGTIAKYLKSEIISEIKGEKGDKGDTGPAGRDGRNGKDGRDGRNADEARMTSSVISAVKDAIPANLEAKDIAEKLNTLPGSLKSEVIKDLPASVSAKEVVEELKKLKGNDRLDISNIRNGEQLSSLAQKAASGGFNMGDQRWHGSGSGSGVGGVESIAVEGDPALTGAVTLSEGSNITLAQVGNDIEISSSGGGGSPGGSNTQVQFNDEGAFGGDASLIFDKFIGKLSVGRIDTIDGIIENSGVASNPYFNLQETAIGLAFDGEVGANSTGGIVQISSGIGGSTSGAGGTLSISAGDAGGDGEGGALNISAGNSVGTNNQGGDLTLRGGEAEADIYGALLSLFGATPANDTGGLILMHGGDVDDGIGGEVTIRGGNSTDGGSAGVVNIIGGGSSGVGFAAGDVNVFGGSSLEDTAGNVTIGPGEGAGIGYVKLISLPTEDPGVTNALWNENGFVRISAGD